MKQVYLHCLFLLFSVQYLSSQVLDATISVDGTNRLVITINSPAAFQFNQTHSGVPVLIIDEVYAVDAPNLTTSVNGGSGISYTGSNGTSGTATNMGPYGFNFGVYTIRDDEVTFSDPGPSFTSGDIITIQTGTIISLATFVGTPPAINAGPYNAFIASDDFNSIAAAQIMLPVELTKFTGRKTDNHVCLNWETATETDNHGFQIEHGTDGENWKEIGYVVGNGTSAIFNEYEFIHKNSSNGENYYRLKQIDYDGNYEYSKIINVELTDHNKIVVNPNPTSGMIRIVGIQEGQITILDTTGRVVKEEFMSGEEVDISDLPIGLYFVQILNGSELFTELIMKSSN